MDASTLFIIRPRQVRIAGSHDIHVDEIRSENEFRTDVAAVGAKELEPARRFWNALEAPFAPEEFKDEYRAELEAMLARKAAQGGTSTIPRTSCCNEACGGHLEALNKSIRMTRKLAASETPPGPKNAGRVPEIKSKRPARKAR
jgi:non-homologous end joining protein Ku